jgi:hypothetical protein
MSRLIKWPIVRCRASVCPMAGIVLPLIIACSGCGENDSVFRFPKGAFEDRSAEYSLWENRNPDGTLLDLKCSQFKPRAVLHGVGSLSGHWLSRSKMSELLIENLDKNNPDHAGIEGPGFEGDSFVVSLKDQGCRVWRFYRQAAYEDIAVYGVDIDGDGIDELAVERGMCRGTSVYVRSLEIYKMEKFVPIFEISLNGYLSCNAPDSPGPVCWDRRYAFIKNHATQNLDVYVYLVAQEESPKSIASAYNLDVLQFPRRVYSYNRTRETFTVSQFGFKKLP